MWWSIRPRGDSTSTPLFISVVSVIGLRAVCQLEIRPLRGGRRSAPEQQQGESHDGCNHEGDGQDEHASADHTGEEGEDDRRDDERRVEAAAGQLSGRQLVPDAEQSGDPGLSEGAQGLLDRLRDLGEPEGFRHVVGGPVRPWDAGDHTVPLRGERAPVRGFGGRAPVRPLLRQAAREPGVRRGAQPPSPEPSVYTLGRLAHDQLASRLWRFRGYLESSAEALNGDTSPATSANSRSADRL